MDQSIVKKEERINDWLERGDGPPPDELVRDLRKIGTRLTGVLGAHLMRALRSMEVVDRFIQAAEKDLFSEEATADLTPEELLERYRVAASMRGETLESVRRFSSQLRNMKTEPEEEVDEARELLKTLPKDKIRSLIESLKSRGSE
jgi:hypothetical protein